MMVMLLLTHFAFSSENAFGQQNITVQFEQQSLSEVLRVLKQKTNYEFLYNDEEIKGITGITRSFTNASVQEILTACLAGTKYSFKIVDNLIVITPDDKKDEIKKAKATNWDCIKSPSIYLFYPIMIVVLVVVFILKCVKII